MTKAGPAIDVQPYHWLIVRDILRKYVAQYSVWAFGSRATWNAKTFSDLDLAIITNKTLPLAMSADLNDAFSESDLPWKVDLVDWSAISDDFRKLVARDKVVVQEAKEAERKVTILPLGACLDALIEYRGKTPHKVDEGIPLITAKVVKSGRILPLDEFIADEDYAAWMKRGHPKIGDVVLTTEAPLGEVAQIRFLPVALAQQIVTLRGKEGVLDSNYLLYLLQSEEMQAKLLGRSTGTTVVGIKQSELRSIEVALPDITEQRAVANILGPLDDKFELNRRRNQTLEAMARAQFHDWFIDFGPVRAKMEGREPYLPADLWRLFPDRFDHEGKPEGWKEVAAETVADIGIGKTPPRKEHQWFSTADSDVRWVSVRDMGNSGVFLQSTSEYLTSTVVEKFNVRVVPNNTVILSFKLTVGRVAITDGEMVTNEAIAHLKVGDQKKISTEYLYSYLREFDYGRLGSTSSMETAVNSKSIKALPVLVPAHDLAGHFTRRVVPIFARIKHLQSEAATLAQLRDTLLPKLISGELRIADTERFMETHR